MPGEVGEGGLTVTVTVTVYLFITRRVVDKLSLIEAMLDSASSVCRLSRALQL